MPSMVVGGSVDGPCGEECGAAGECVAGGFWECEEQCGDLGLRWVEPGHAAA